MDMNNVTNLEGAFEAVKNELLQANKTHPLFTTRHEGYAVLLEEVDELWDDVKCNAPSMGPQSECVQIAAMAIKMLISPIWK